MVLTLNLFEQSWGKLEKWCEKCKSSNPLMNVVSLQSVRDTHHIPDQPFDETLEE